MEESTKKGAFSAAGLPMQDPMSADQMSKKGQACCLTCCMYEDECICNKRKDSYDVNAGKTPRKNLGRYRRTSAKLLSERETEDCTLEIATRDVLLHYIRYRLEHKGYDLEDHKSPQIRTLFRFVGKFTVSAAGEIIQDLGNRLDSHYPSKLFLDRSVQDLKLNEQETRKAYVDWIDNLFHDKKITWGRVAITLVFTARLVEEAMVYEKYYLVEDAISWCCQCFKYYMLEEWISASGGWSKLPPIDGIKELPLRKRMPGILPIIGSTLILVAIGTVGYFLTRRK